MADLEIDLPDHIDVQIEQMIEEGEFISREEAMEELLSLGLSTYDTGDIEDEEGDLAFADEMQNPGDRKGPQTDDEFDI